MSSYDPVVLQPLLHHPYDGQHVCPVDIFFRNCVSFRERAVPCSLPVCRWVKLKYRMQSDNSQAQTWNCIKYSKMFLLHTFLFPVAKQSCFFLGVISTMVSYMCKTATRRFYPSLGAVRLLNIIKLKHFSSLTCSLCVSPVRGCDGGARCSLCKGARG